MDPELVRSAPAPALPYELALRLADKVIDFEVEQICRQIRTHGSREDWEKLAAYYYAHMTERLRLRLGGDYGAQLAL